MGTQGFYRGTSHDQVPFFANKEKKMIEGRRWPPEFEQEVDMTKVNLDALTSWISRRITEILGFEDDIVIDYCRQQLSGTPTAEGASNDKVCPKKLQINLTGFLAKNSSRFVKELWSLLLVAQNSPGGVPEKLMQEKRLELQAKQAEAERVKESLSLIQPPSGLELPPSAPVSKIVPNIPDRFKTPALRPQRPSSPPRQSTRPDRLSRRSLSRSLSSGRSSFSSSRSRRSWHRSPPRIERHRYTARRRSPSSTTSSSPVRHRRDRSSSFVRRTIRSRYTSYGHSTASRRHQEGRRGRSYRQSRGSPHGDSKRRDYPSQRVTEKKSSTSIEANSEPEKQQPLKVSVESAVESAVEPAKEPASKGRSRETTAVDRYAGRCYMDQLGCSPMTGRLSSAIQSSNRLDRKNGAESHHLQRSMGRLSNSPPKSRNSLIDSQYPDATGAEENHNKRECSNARDHSHKKRLLSPESTDSAKERHLKAKARKILSRNSSSNSKVF